VLHMARYRRVSLMEREELSRMLAAGSSLRAIGQALSRVPSTLSRELVHQHASPVTYRAVSAHQRAQRWAHHPRKLRKLAIQPRLRTAVLRLLAQRWSPEQIARGLPQRYPHEPTMRISESKKWVQVLQSNISRRVAGIWFIWFLRSVSCVWFDE
jgi:IS30 family transposase